MQEVMSNMKMGNQKKKNTFLIKKIWFIIIIYIQSFILIIF